MSNPRNAKAPAGKASPLLTGLMIGMVIGVGLAAGLAWFLMKTPSPFVAKEVAAPKPVLPVVQPEETPASAVAAPNASVPAETGQGDKPRFQFYEVLTDKKEATVEPEPKPKAAPRTAPAPAKPAAPVAAPAPAAAAKPAALYLQLASFGSIGDAENLKARLALQGVEAGIQTVNLTGKGTWHRVRVGPYASAAERDKARESLKQNGIDATPMRAQ